MVDTAPFDRVIAVTSGGGQGKVVIDALLAAGIPAHGALDESARDSLAGVPVLGRPADWAQLVAAGTGFAVVMSNGRDRAALATEFAQGGGKLAGVQHPAAFVSPRASVGRGTFLLAGVTIGIDAAIGDFCVLNANVSIDHDCQLGMGVQFGPGATLPGGVVCEDFVFVGAGATILPGKRIGAGAVGWGRRGGHERCRAGYNRCREPRTGHREALTCGQSKDGHRKAQAEYYGNVRPQAPCFFPPALFADGRSHDCGFGANRHVARRQANRGRSAGAS